MSRPGPKIPPLPLTDAQQVVLEGWVRRRTTAQALAQRSRIVLECADGHSIMEVSRRLRIAPDTVRTWRRRFLEHGLDGLCDEPRPGVPRKITDADVERVIVGTLEEKPKNATHWSTRSMAAATGMSQSTVSRIWRAFALAPHRSQTFKLSTDPFFIDKVRDVVGLYLDPPEKALVLCVDEKSRIQALDRSQPVLPMMPGVPERRSHDCIRAGTTTLFAALEVATGKVIGSLHRRHRAIEFKKFLAKLDKEVPASLQVHLILDPSRIRSVAGRFEIQYFTGSASPSGHWAISQTRGIVPSAAGFGRRPVRRTRSSTKCELIAAFEPLGQVTVRPWRRPAASTWSRKESGRVR